MMKRFLMILVMVLWCSNAYAELDVATYLEIKKKNDTQANNLVDSYISGIGSGLFWSNTAAGFQGGKELYCQPTGLALGLDNYVDFLDREIDQQINSGNLDDNNSVGMLILKHLQKVFPCK